MRAWKQSDEPPKAYVLPMMLVSSRFLDPFRYNIFLKYLRDVARGVKWRGRASEAAVATRGAAAAWSPSHRVLAKDHGACQLRACGPRRCSHALCAAAEANATASAGHQRGAPERRLAKHGLPLDKSKALNITTSAWRRDHDPGTAYGVF
jgi:hypothetical protein